MKSAVYALLGLGFLLLALSAVWGSFFPATSSWTPDKERELSDLKKRVHNLSFAVTDPARQVARPGEKTPAEIKAEYEKSKQEAEALMAEFQSAHDRPNIISTTLKWTGISLAGVGLAGWVAVRNN